MPEGMRFFSSKVRNNFLFYLPSLIRHCGISRGLCFPYKPAHQMTPMHQLGAVLTDTKGRRVVLTLVQWLTAPCSSGDTSRILRIHPAFSPCSWRWKYLLHPLLSHPDLAHHILTDFVAGFWVSLWCCSEFWECGTLSPQRDKDVLFI